MLLVEFDQPLQKSAIQLKVGDLIRLLLTMPRKHTKAGRTLVEGWKFEVKARRSRGQKCYFFTDPFDNQVIVEGKDKLTPQQKAAIKVAKRVKKATRTKQLNKEAQLGKDVYIERLQKTNANLHRELEQVRDALRQIIVQKEEDARRFEEELEELRNENEILKEQLGLEEETILPEVSKVE